MPDYKEMYLTAVRASREAVYLMEKATQILIDAQQRCEEMYIDAPDPALTLLPRREEEPEDR